jgi:hypothetical protein
MYHTHGAGIANPGAELPSGDDIMIMRAQGVFSFIGTPNNHIKKFTPNALLPPSEQQPFGFKQETLR